jgi:hypothetical protein
MWFFGKNRGMDLVDKVKALQKDSALAQTKAYLDQLYAFLTILDTKATGLLTVDTILLAILLAFLDNPRDVARLIRVDTSKLVLILKIQLGLAAFSALLCLLVVRVTWRFLAKVPRVPTTADDFSDEVRRLANVIYDRTTYYWFAWWFALLAFIGTSGWWSWWYLALAALVITVWSVKRG